MSTKSYEILACPACKRKLEFQQEPLGLICRDCGVRYPINDGIPVLLIDQARKDGDSSP